MIFNISNRVSNILCYIFVLWLISCRTGRLPNARLGNKLIYIQPCNLKFFWAPEMITMWVCSALHIYIHIAFLIWYLICHITSGPYSPYKETFILPIQTLVCKYWNSGKNLLSFLRQCDFNRQDYRVYLLCVLQSHHVLMSNSKPTVHWKMHSVQLQVHAAIT
jgi:hypothetical protein